MDFRVPYFWRNPYEKKMNLIPKKNMFVSKPHMFSQNTRSPKHMDCINSSFGTVIQNVDHGLGSKPTTMAWKQGGCPKMGYQGYPWNLLTDWIWGPPPSAASAISRPCPGEMFHEFCMESAGQEMSKIQWTPWWSSSVGLQRSVRGADSGPEHRVSHIQ